MAQIALEGMEFFSYHGHFEEESVIGTRFLIDMYLTTPTKQAELSDELEHTVNYQEVYLTIKEEMKTPSKLIEHVSRRIIDAVMEKFPNITKCSVKMKKLNPPLGGQLESVSITITSES